MLREAVQQMVDAEDVSAIQAKVAGKRILIASRYKHNEREMSDVYGVIGFYVGSILESCGAEVTYYYVPYYGDRYPAFARGNKYDIGIVCYFDTDEMVRKCSNILSAVQSFCKKSFYYSNLVIYFPGFTRYFVSRECYLIPKSTHWYGRHTYSLIRTHNVKKASFVGRGADYMSLKPSDTEFCVLADATRGPWSKGTTKLAYHTTKLLEQMNIPVIRMGIGKSGKRSHRVRYTRAVSWYNDSNVYVSGISGLYELPVVESQLAGNYVISWNNKLHPDLLCKSSSFVCRTNEDFVERIEWIKNNYDANIPRNFAMNGFKWTDVIRRMVEHF